MDSDEFDKIDKMMNSKDGDSSSIRVLKDIIDSESEDMFLLIKEINKLCHNHSLFSGSMACGIACAMILRGSKAPEETNFEMLNMISSIQEDVIKGKMFSYGR